MILWGNIGGSGSPPIQTTASHLPLHCDSCDCASCNYDGHLVHTSSISPSKAPHSKARQSRPLQWAYFMPTTGQQLLGTPSSQRSCLPSKGDVHSSLQSPNSALLGETRQSRLLQMGYITQTASERDPSKGATTPLLLRKHETPDLSTCFAMFCFVSGCSCPSHKLQTVSWHRLESGCGFVRVRKWTDVCALRVNRCCVCVLMCASCEQQGNRLDPLAANSAVLAQLRTTTAWNRFAKEEGRTALNRTNPPFVSMVSGVLCCFVRMFLPFTPAPDCVSALPPPPPDWISLIVYMWLSECACVFHRSCDCSSVCA